MACPAEADLIAFLAGGLATDRRDEIERHFDGCTECRQLAYVLATEGGGAEAAGHSLGVGARVGRFLIEEQIAAGAMGIIYRAHDTTLRRDVAIKLLRGVSSDGHARMLREAPWARGHATLARLPTMSSLQRILVVGATGTQGGSVARHLLRVDTCRVRCLTPPAATRPDTANPAA